MTGSRLASVTNSIMRNFDLDNLSKATNSHDGDNPVAPNFYESELFKPRFKFKKNESGVGGGSKDVKFYMLENN